MLPAKLVSASNVAANATITIDTEAFPLRFWVQTLRGRPLDTYDRVTITLSLPDGSEVTPPDLGDYPSPWPNSWSQNSLDKDQRTQPGDTTTGNQPLNTLIPAGIPIRWTLKNNTSATQQGGIELYGFMLEAGESPPKQKTWHFPSLPSLKRIDTGFQLAGEGNNTPTPVSSAKPPPFNPIATYNLEHPTAGQTLIETGSTLYPTRLGQPSLNIPPFQPKGGAAPPLPTVLSSLTGQSYEGGRFIRASQTGRLHTGSNFISRRTGRIHETDATTTTLTFFPPAERLELQSDYGSAKVQFINAAEANSGVDVATVDPIYIGPGETYELNFDCVVALVQADDRTGTVTPFALTYRAYY